MSDADERVERLAELVGHTFRDGGLALLALTHPSYAHEAGGGRGNERLEFLGDAVLDLVVSESLFASRPDWEEGKLTRARAAWVRGEVLARRARELGLPELVLLGRTELRSGGAEKDSILANAYEAVVGALYLDGGLEPVRALVADWLEGADAPTTARDAKTRFQEWAHQEHRETPRYHTVGDSGVEADEARFRVEVRVGERVFGEGAGRSKRLAEREAAESALDRVEKAAS